MSYIGQTKQLALFDSYTKAQADAVLGIPAGAIIFWSGSILSIPEGWALCDGTNGTPDLQDRFVVGAGSTYAVDDVGGSADAVVVSHTHTGSTNSAGSHSHSGSTNTTGAHTHNVGVTGTGGFDGTAGVRGSDLNQFNNAGAHALSAGNHSHSLSINSNGSHTHSFTTDSSGESGVGKNLPPYHALAYIMKL